MKKMLLYVIVILLYALVTFFGLGPVLLADGTMNERMITLAVVIIIYVVITIIFRKLLKK